MFHTRPREYDLVSCPGYGRREAHHSRGGCGISVSVWRALMVKCYRLSDFNYAISCLMKECSTFCYYNMMSSTDVLGLIQSYHGMHAAIGCRMDTASGAPRSLRWRWRQIGPSWGGVKEHRFLISFLASGGLLWSLMFFNFKCLHTHTTLCV